MSIIQRITLQEAVPPAEAAPAVLRRCRYPRSAFAMLATDPPDAADAAYQTFSLYLLTPGVAERKVAQILQGTSPRCALVEESPGYAFELELERTEAGRLRVFARHLVQMQFALETNLRQLQALRETRGIRRLRILPGCCDVCDAYARHAYRLSNPPPLPVRGCTRHGGCKCAYVPEID
jgi:hypothetical protein